MPDAQRRSSDKWFAKAEYFWDWFDGRQIDRHLASAAIFAVSLQITLWAEAFANAHPNESAGTIAAIMGPWALAQTLGLKFILESRDAKDKS